jgi:class 3 adenylate cyclase
MVGINGKHGMAESDTAADGLERKLATILSADVAAYSRLMAEDEERTLQTFRAHKEVFEKLVQLHRGRVFNTAGDAILAEFGSAVEAVRCATEIQAALRTRNDQLPSNRQVNFRIGVNLGDVMVQGVDLLGDGVNVAARLQGAAEPGGICISGSVYDQVLNKLSLSFKPLGELSYKNLPQPVRTFAIARVAGLGVLPSPARRRQLVNGLRSRPFLIAALVLITAGGVSWVRSHYDHNRAEYAPTTGLHTPQVDQRRIEREERRIVRANRKIGDANPLAAPEAGQSDQVGGATAATTPGDDRSGVYRGQMCYGAGGATELAHCFEAQAVVLGNRINGEWPGREPGVTIFLAGEISRIGEVVIHMHSTRADGSRFAVCDLIGTARDGRIDAKGSFRDGRSVMLNWAKN